MPRQRRSQDPSDPSISSTFRTRSRDASEATESKRYLSLGSFEQVFLGRHLAVAARPPLLRLEQLRNDQRLQLEVHTHGLVESNREHRFGEHNDDDAGLGEWT
eukprot:1380262-Rhodomonas_salina.2